MSTTKQKHEKDFGGGRIRNKFITANKDSSIIESEKVNLMEVFSAK